MIEAKEVKTKLDRYYKEVKQKEESVFKCKRVLKNNAYQYFYFDYSGNPEKSEEYYRDLLAEDYYKNPGSLQWNFYLAFLTEDDIKPKLKKEIEKNEDFARKFVLRYDNLDKWLNRLYNTEFESDQEEYKDLAEVWREVLKSRDLDCVYSRNIDDNEGIEAIIDGNPIEESIDDEITQHFDDNEINLGFIKKLDPQGFREHLNYEQPFFNFSKVNLIEGVNGTGKTTLLEAIEYFVTGSNFRDDQNSTSKKVKALLEEREGFIESPDPNNYDLFRARDKAWYNNASRIRGSILNSNFNKFNFFNTDAAFRLSHEKDSEEEVENAFREIALGENVSRLKREIERYKRKLEDEKKNRKSKLDALQSELADKKETLLQLKEVGESPQKLLDEFNNELKSINWEGIIPESVDQNLEQLSVQFTKIKSRLESLSKTQWLKNDTLQNLKNEKRRLNKLKNLFSKKHDFLNENEGLKKDQKEKNKRIEILQKLKAYYSEGIGNVSGLNQSIKDKTKYINKLSSLEVKLSNINYSPFTEVSEPLESKIKEVNRLESEMNQELNELNKRINDIKSGISELEDILSSLRSKGLKFVEKSGTSICPLCKHEHNDKQQLINRIEETYSKLQSSDLLTGLMKKKEDIQENIEELNNQVKILTQLEEVFLKLDLRNKINENDLTDLIGIAETTIGNLGKIKRELNELKTFKENLHDKGLAESEFDSLLEELKSYDIEIPESLEDINSRISNIANEVEEISQTISKNESNLNKVKKEIDENLYKDDDELSYEIIKNRLTTIKRHKSRVEFIKDYVQFGDKESLLGLKQDIIDLEEILGKVREQKDFRNKSDKQYEKVEKRINDIEPKINDLEEEIGRISDALDTFDELDKHHSEDDFLADFLKRNRGEIESIFLAIHSPNEFSEVLLGDGGLKVKRENTGEVHGLNSISTGQRSALALSVFLTLNSKLTNGPKYILLDDPIAFIDDLNILSFIDYLREIAISSDKQIFFATANQDLAFLFRKKFEVLGDEFERIQLDK